MKWIESKNPNHLWLKDRHNDYGDWLNGDTLVLPYAIGDQSISIATVSIRALLHSMVT